MSNQYSDHLTRQLHREVQQRRDRHDSGTPGGNLSPAQVAALDALTEADPATFGRSPSGQVAQVLFDAGRQAD